MLEQHISARSTGWIYAASFNSNEEKIASMTFGNPVTINNVKYTVLLNNLSIDEVSAFMKTVEPSWKTE